MGDPENEVDGEPELVVLKCEDCGDTFPSRERPAACASCGSRNVHEAHEPLL